MLRMSLTACTDRARFCMVANTGVMSAARTPTMAMTTSNSTRVKPVGRLDAEVTGVLRMMVNLLLANWTATFQKVNS